MSIFTKVGAWIAKIFKSIKNEGAHLAVAITEGVKGFLNAGVADALASVVDSIAGTHLAEDIVTLLKNNINKILAAELAIQGMPDNPTESDILSFENAVIKAFTGLDSAGKSKLYSTLAAQVYGILKAHADSGQAFTFAQLVADVEAAWADYQKDLADSEQPTNADGLYPESAAIVSDAENATNAGNTDGIPDSGSTMPSAVAGDAPQVAE